MYSNYDCLQSALIWCAIYDSLKRPATSAAAAGLSSVLGKIGKKPKISVLVVLVLLFYLYTGILSISDMFTNKNWNENDVKTESKYILNYLFGLFQAKVETETERKIPVEITMLSCAACHLGHTNAHVLLAPEFIPLPSVRNVHSAQASLWPIYP